MRQPVYVFKHVGTDSNAEQRQSQAMLGCAPAQVLFEKVVSAKKKPDVTSPRYFHEYDVTVDRQSIPAGVELLELPGDMEKL